MNHHDDELLIRSLARLDNDPDARDPEVERHIAEIRTALAEVDRDPALAGRLDASFAKAQRQLFPDVDTDVTRGVADVPEPEGLLRGLDKRELQQRQENLAAVRDEPATTVARPRQRLGMWSRLDSVYVRGFAGVISLFMLVGAVLLAVLGGAGMSGIVPIFAIVPALVALVPTITTVYLARRAAGGDHESFHVLTMMNRTPAVEVQDIEARERVAMAAIRAAAMSGKGARISYSNGEVRLSG